MTRARALGRRLLAVCGHAVWLGAFSFLVFALLHAMPGRTEDHFVSSDPSVREADLARFVALGGLDRSVTERHACWVLGRAHSGCEYWSGDGWVRGDLGWSSAHGAPVASLVRERLGNTLWITVPAFLVGLGLALLLGAFAAHEASRWRVRLVTLTAIVAVGVPVHWLALASILVFALGLGLVPASGADGAALVLPVAVLALLHAGRWVRHVRGAFVRASRSELFLAERARGLRDSRALAIALRSELAPVLVVVMSSIPSIFGGAVVVERVFSVPGIGLLIFESIQRDDHAVAATLLTLYAAITWVAIELLDLVSAAVDPSGGAS